MRAHTKFTVSFAFILAMLITPAVMATNATPVQSNYIEPDVMVQPTTGDSKDVYQGTMRIYMVEPFSRYVDGNNNNYQFGFLDYATIQGLNINTGEVYTHVVEWDASDSGFTGVDPDNIMAQAVLFGPDPYVNYSDPPTGAPFFAYWTDAAAQATPTLPGQDFKSVDFTHTVFLEEMTRYG